MKKYLLLAIFLNCISINAQNKIAKKVAELQNLNASFKTISVLSPSQNAINNDINKVVENATLATLNLSKINEIVINKYDYIELEIPYQNQIIPVLLYKVNPFAEGFHVDTDKGKYITYEKGVYYRGIINGETNSVSSFNFFNGEFNGVVSSSALGNLVVGKLDKPNNQVDYIVYSDAKMKVINEFECHTKEEAISELPTRETNRNVNSDRCVQFYFEIDTNLYENNGSDTTATTNWMTSVFNNVQTLYNNDGITVSLKSIFIWTDPDPYEGVGTSSSAYLNLFRSNTTVFDGDVGMLVGIDPGGLGGVAFLNTLCATNNYAYSDVNLTYQTVPTYSWTIEVITHEFGHSLGSPHTHACYWNGNNTRIDGCGPAAGYNEGSCGVGPIPSVDEKGTIMSYCHLVSGVGISFNNGFGPQPAALILSNVNNKTCLSLDCVTSCTNTVSNITATNIGTGSATITWTDSGVSSSWQVSVTPVNSTTPVWNTVSSTTFNINGLLANTYYKVRVRPFCNNVEPLIRETIFATAATNLCSFLFTDTGGSTSNYSDLESWTRTMMPSGNGLKMKVTFSSFNLETDYDYLYVFNGSNEFFPDLSNGGFTGTAVPSPINSTATDGSLTFKFTSDEAVVTAGWNATVTCTGTLGIDDTNYLDYSYYPNPTNGKVTITSKDVITDVAVYNIAGQLLFNQKNNGLTTSVDISQFATGTYFFKLKFNEKEANFKVLKM